MTTIYRKYKLVRWDEDPAARLHFPVLVHPDGSEITDTAVADEYVLIESMTHPLTYAVLHNGDEGLVADRLTLDEAKAELLRRLDFADDFPEGVDRIEAPPDPVTPEGLGTGPDVDIDWTKADPADARFALEDAQSTLHLAAEALDELRLTLNDLDKQLGRLEQAAETLDTPDGETRLDDILSALTHVETGAENDWADFTPDELGLAYVEDVRTLLTLLGHPLPG